MSTEHVGSHMLSKHIIYRYEKDGSWLPHSRTYKKPTKNWNQGWMLKVMPSVVAHSTLTLGSWVERWLCIGDQTGLQNEFQTSLG